MALIIPDEVLKQLEALPKRGADRVREALEQVAADITRRQSFVTEMVGQPGVWRLRKGDWRATYEIVDGNVRVASVSHRKDAYK